MRAYFGNKYFSYDLNYSIKYDQATEFIKQIAAVHFLKVPCCLFRLDPRATLSCFTSRNCFQIVRESLISISFYFSPIFLSISFIFQFLYKYTINNCVDNFRII